MTIKTEFMGNGRNILELKSIRINCEKPVTLEEAKHLPELEGFELIEDYFETVYEPKCPRLGGDAPKSGAAAGLARAFFFKGFYRFWVVMLRKTSWIIGR